MSITVNQLISGQNVRQVSDRWFTCRKNDKDEAGFPEVNGHRIEIVDWMETFTYCKRFTYKDFDFENYDVNKEYEDLLIHRVGFAVWICEATTGLIMRPRDHYEMSLKEMVTAIREMLIEKGEAYMHKAVASHIEEYGLSPRYLLLSEHRREQNEEVVQKLELNEGVIK